MPAATSKDELIAATDKEFAKLEKLIDAIDEGFALQKDEDDTSIKDVIGHRAHWIDLFLGWYHDGMAGKEVHFPAKGYKWSELKPYNANLREQQADMSWDQAVKLLKSNHKKIRQFMADHSDKELYGGPMKGAKNDWTPGRWAEAAGPSHYRSAAKDLRARQRAQKQK
ncbi:ClbS/DfsB family four-helix bundle protein [Maritalea mediterranea]|uniref:ClbS/DfsB family four-helix bundle protein n=1 Tax=Maritalea mediterranea TaxID=2909667 RepID=A0ABS9EC02_9HYPH|nr:ClbS/DfsB family four-helix bundle protein [Maritalea mediterranea]MCF4099285.1 ClbS/DfsB family four-helix bundle protein [Maritalea mediterranea]